MSELVLVSGFLAVTLGIIYLLAKHDDPYRTKPIPSGAIIKAELTRLAVEDKSEKFKVHFYPHVDIYCPFYDIDNVPQIVYGNKYYAILELDKYFINKIYFITYLRDQAARSWIVGKNSFVDEMCKCLFNSSNDCFYLTK